MTDLIVLQGCRTIQLTDSSNTLIDEADFHLVCDTNWYPMRKHKKPYVSGANCLIHRVIAEAPKGLHVDHYDGDARNNTRDNLRVCTPTQNFRNRRCGFGASRYKGVAPHRKKWKARISLGPGLGYKYIGAFSSEAEAAHAYDAAATELYGEFACTNAEIYGDF